MSEEEETTLTDSAASDIINKFLTTFQTKEREFKYVKKIDEMPGNRKTSITIDFIDLADYEKIITKILNDPSLMETASIRAVYEILREYNPPYADSIKEDIRVGFTNCPNEKTIRQIKAKSKHKMISCKGMVVSSTKVSQTPIIKIFKCPDNHKTQIQIPNYFELGKSRVPIKCSNPKCSHRELELDADESEFIDFQILEIQELPDEQIDENPTTIHTIISHDLVDSVKAGDRVMVTGIPRLIPIKISSEVYRLRLKANNVEIYLPNRLTGSGVREVSDFSKEEVKQIKDIANSPEPIKDLVESYAPHIEGNDNIKEAIIYLMIGGVSTTLPDGSKNRGSINILLFGDPGTAKSEMLKFCARIAPKGVLANGPGASGVGLTAAAIKDQETGMFALKAGALVLGDLGVTCIDEFDKINEEDRKSLHMPMEQQKIAVSKGGIHTELNTRTSLLAAGNPINGKYNPFKNFDENTNLPSTLLTRFDLIFLFRDIPNKERDTKIASHIVYNRTDANPNWKTKIDVESLTKYLIYAKSITPSYSDEAKKMLHDYYLKMRRVTEKENDESSVPITPRYLEAMMRLASARAKARLSDTVDEDDARRAIELVEGVLYDIGIDVESGKLDVGILEKSSSKNIVKNNLFMDILKGLESPYDYDVSIDKLVEEMIKSEKWSEKDDAIKWIKQMQNEGMILSVKDGFIRRKAHVG